jgi:regulator of protease activity HflC (stomatin/prohibitin superfamily)
MEERRSISPIKLIVGGVIGVLAVIIASCGITVVDTGHRGVKTHFGEVEGEGLTEGLYWINPFTEDIAEMSVQVLKWTEDTTAYTKDVQQATVGFTLNYRLDPAKVHVVYREVGRDWSEKLVAQVIYEDIKRELGQHNAVDLIAQRDQAARAIEARVLATLGRRDVIVTNFQLTNISFTQKFEHAVEEKVVAEQEAIREKNNTEKIKQLAMQKVETARGQAEATLLNAKAEAESIQIRAQALEQNAKLVEYELATRWDGKLPTTMVPGGGVPLINLPKD